ncbi:hypothetical protein ACLOJK_033502 [Asimina triloba]
MGYSCQQRQDLTGRQGDGLVLLAALRRRQCGISNRREDEMQCVIGDRRGDRRQRRVSNRRAEEMGGNAAEMAMRDRLLQRRREAARGQQLQGRGDKRQRWILKLHLP